MARHIRRAFALTVGGVLLLIGVALLVLPGPGMLLVLAGLVVLAREFPSVDRHIEPVRVRAVWASEESVSSPWRIAGSVLAALCLIGAGIVWGVVPGLPFEGWSVGSGLILSGIVLAVLLVWSYRQVRAKRESVLTHGGGDHDEH
ncbi:PGPGW domain-containing protein [Streptomyces sp. RFCAC02]|uniref:PGPGW domain-containing protein n=1 Tax=Streptomyces sp. RFCAC02 TaxID=2499143 RepID=UPI0010207F10|nr:PGPGW domain-containing protein [Streptomyces sp. RFCAC02]